MQSLGTFLREKIPHAILAQSEGSDEFQLSYHGHVSDPHLRSWLDQFSRPYGGTLDHSMFAQLEEGGTLYALSVEHEPSRRVIKGSLRARHKQLDLVFA